MTTRYASDPVHTTYEIANFPWVAELVKQARYVEKNYPDPDHMNAVQPIKTLTEPDDKLIEFVLLYPLLLAVRHRGNESSARRLAPSKRQGNRTFWRGGGQQETKEIRLWFSGKMVTVVVPNQRRTKQIQKDLGGGGAGSWGCFEDDRVPRRAVHPPLGDDGEAGREHVKVDEVPHATHCLGVCMRPVVGEQQTRVVVGHADTRVAECVHLDGNA